MKKLYYLSIALLVCTHTLFAASSSSRAAPAAAAAPAPSDVFAQYLAAPAYAGQAPTESASAKKAKAADACAKADANAKIADAQRATPLSLQLREDHFALTSSRPAHLPAVAAGASAAAAAMATSAAEAKTEAAAHHAHEKPTEKLQLYESNSTHQCRELLFFTEDPDVYDSRSVLLPLQANEKDYARAIADFAKGSFMLVDWDKQKIPNLSTYPLHKAIIVVTVADLNSL
jgi:hypothetical protein